MEYQVTTRLKLSEYGELAHQMWLASWEKQREAAFWEGMGDSHNNKKALEKQKLFAKMATIYALASNTQEDIDNYINEMEKENV